MRVLFLILSLVIPSARAASGVSAPLNGMIMGSFDYHYLSSAADAVAGATYSRSYANPASFKLEVGFVPVKNLYLGFTLDYWLAGRTITAGGTTTDKLTYDVVGAELGYISSNPRAFFLISASVGYPVQLFVESSSGGRYAPASMPLVYGARAMIGFRLFSFLAVTAQGGYHLRDLGSLTASGNPYVTGSWDMSGFYLSPGVAFTF